MNRILIAVATLSLACTFAGAAQPNAQTVAPAHTMSTQEAKSLMKTAHDSVQYAALADYFKQKEQTYSMKRDAMFQLWSTRAKAVAVNQNKYPRPVDSAHSLYDYYSYETNQAAAQAQRYDQLTAQATSKP